MDQPENPYSAPTEMAPPVLGGQDEADLQTARLLIQTKPWVRFISILMMIVGVLAGVGAVVGPLFIGFASSETPITALTMFGVYLLMSLLYVIPAWHLSNYANRISKYAAAPDRESLNSALQAQRSFWKFVGIAAAFVIGVYLLLAVFGGIIGAAGFIR